MRLLDQPVTRGGGEVFGMGAKKGGKGSKGGKSRKEKKLKERGEQKGPTGEGREGGGKAELPAEGGPAGYFERKRETQKTQDVFAPTIIPLERKRSPKYQGRKENSEHRRPKKKKEQPKKNIKEERIRLRIQCRGVSISPGSVGESSAADTRAERGGGKACVHASSANLFFFLILGGSWCFGNSIIFRSVFYY